jgi:hypothetical protein
MPMVAAKRRVPIKKRCTTENAPSSLFFSKTPLEYDFDWVAAAGYRSGASRVVGSSGARIGPRNASDWEDSEAPPQRWIVKSTAGKISRRDTRNRFLEEGQAFPVMDRIGRVRRWP